MKTFSLFWLIFLLEKRREKRHFFFKEKLLQLQETHITTITFPLLQCVKIIFKRAGFLLSLELKRQHPVIKEILAHVS